MELTLLWILSVCLITYVYGTITGISVQTNVGTINGLTDGAVQFQDSIKTVSRFLGIPFAKPPVGDRRFRRPEVLETLQSPHNALYHRSHCLQPGTGGNEYIKQFTMDEDCLYLNIYVPGSDISTKNKYPVMIWIYGGSFLSGGADIYNGDILSAHNDVIVVTFNYRVGSFGFLSDGSRNSGNFGLWDQKMAIQWVHDNIHSFGGDTNKVTLFGQSAGAASVLYQALHVGNKGKINRIIAQSGSPLAPWALDSEMTAKNNFKTFAKSQNCHESTNELTLKCLRNTNAEFILSKSEIMFFPVVDMDFVKESPMVLFANKTDAAQTAMKQFGSLDFLSGVNNKEGSNIIIGVWGPYLKALGTDINDGVPKQIFDSVFLPNYLKYAANILNYTTITEAVIHEYTDWANPNDKTIVRDKMIDLASDISFFVPAVNTAKSHSNMTSSDVSSVKTYFYVFDHKLNLDPNPIWLKGTKQTLEIPYVFGFPDIIKVVLGAPPAYPIQIPVNELALSSVVMKMWTNFAKTGTPITESMQQPTWPVYSSDTQQYLTLSSNITSHSVQQRFAAARVAFWTDLIPALQTCSKPMTSPVDTNEVSGAGVVMLDVTLVLLVFCYIF